MESLKSGTQKMKTTFITITAAALLVSSSAWAKKHPPMTEAEYTHCLNLGFDEAGDAWCIKSDAGMNENQIVKYNLREDARRKAEEAARIKAEEKNYPDNAPFISCMNAQAAATNIAEATNGPEVWPIWAQFSEEECGQILAKVINDAFAGEENSRGQ